MCILDNAVRVGLSEMTFENKHEWNEAVRQAKNPDVEKSKYKGPAMEKWCVQDRMIRAE